MLWLWAAEVRARARKVVMLARRSEEAQALLVRGKRDRKPSAKVPSLSPPRPATSKSRLHHAQVS